MRTIVRRLVLVIGLVAIMAPPMTVSPTSDADAAVLTVTGGSPVSKAVYSTGTRDRLRSRTALRTNTSPRAAWTSGEGRRAAWIRWTAPTAVRVDSMRIAGTGGARRIVTGSVRFDDGSRIAVRTDARGNAVLRFRARTVRSAVLTVTGMPKGSGRAAIRRWTISPAAVVTAAGSSSVEPGRTTEAAPSAEEGAPAAAAPSTAAASGPAAPAPDDATASPVAVATTPADPPRPSADAAADVALPASAGTVPSASTAPTGPTSAAASTSAVSTPAVSTPVASPPAVLTATSPAARAEVPTASATSGAAAALIDARDAIPATTGATWEASASGPQEVTLSWPAPVAIATLQIYGSPAATGAASAARAVFSDGSVVRLLPVAAGAATPSTVAFTPRTVRSVTVRLTPKTTAPLQLREIAAFAPGSLAPTTTLGGLPSSTLAAAPSCGAATAAASAALRLVCPLTGQRLSGASSIVVVSAPEGATVTAAAVLRTGATAVVATARTTGGTAALRVDATTLPVGPVVIRVTATGVAKPLTAQFVSDSGGMAASVSSTIAAGRSLVYADEFDSPLSISATGSGAAYAATKPASWGNSDFGDAIFVDPVTRPENLSSFDGGYLRIRTTPLAAGETDPSGWGRTHRGGILSSASINGGFAAQHGYFEIRMLAPASPGTWPAFWMMSDGFLEDSQSSENSEVDAVELYGQDASYSCHSWHDWLGVATKQGGKVDCVHALGDWSGTWHTYGVDIGADATRYYIDGRLVSTGAAVKNAGDPFYFMADLSLGGGWPVDLSGVNGVADLYVDYVRVYV